MKNRMNIEIANDHSVARLTFKMDSGRTESIRVTSQQIEEYVQLLAMARMELEPPVTDEPVVVELDVTDVDPEIRFSLGTAAGRRQLAMRHRGLGWISFELSADRATELAADLLRDLPAKG